MKRTLSMGLDNAAWRHHMRLECSEGFIWCFLHIFYDDPFKFLHLLVQKNGGYISWNFGPFWFTSAFIGPKTLYFGPKIAPRFGYFLIGWRRGLVRRFQGIGGLNRRFHGIGWPPGLTIFLSSRFPVWLWLLKERLNFWASIFQFQSIFIALSGKSPEPSYAKEGSIRQVSIAI